jgi:hypothetical protein
MGPEYQRLLILFTCRSRMADGNAQLIAEQEKSKSTFSVGFLAAENHLHGEPMACGTAHSSIIQTRNTPIGAKAIVNLPVTGIGIIPREARVRFSTSLKPNATFWND